MNATNTDRIEKQLLLRAPKARVWKALTHYEEFNTWFRVKMEGPFVPGKKVKGKNAYPGYEHLLMDIQIEKMEPEKYFSYRWTPYAADVKVDYSKETPTLVEFHLEEAPGGTLLTVTESGFDQIPAFRRDEAFRMNSGGWEEQLKNVARHVQ